MNSILILFNRYPLPKILVSRSAIYQWLYESKASNTLIRLSKLDNGQLFPMFKTNHLIHRKYTFYIFSHLKPDFSGPKCTPLQQPSYQFPYWFPPCHLTFIFISLLFLSYNPNITKKSNYHIKRWLCNNQHHSIIYTC